MSYARPHLQTHNRKDGHSSVRGAAYRLGVDMLDERTGEICRFSSKGRDNVVAHWHLADENTPAWQRNAEMFWNAVEAGEKRVDSQVARDFRIPVPLGFDQVHAEKLALAVARRLRAELGGVPVSVGLHHDNRRDAFGDYKDPESVGFHAHIYMPTRGVSADGMAAKKEGVFLDLGNKNKSGVIVERFNEIWASEATILAHAQGLDTTYDHRSNVRQGIDRKPQPRLGQQVVAMERRGLTTERGDMFHEHMAAHPIPEAMNHAAALADIEREKKTLLTRIPSHDRPPNFRHTTRASTLDRTGIDAARVRPGRDENEPLLAMRALNRAAIGLPSGGATAGQATRHRTFATLGYGGVLRGDEPGYYSAGETLHVVHRETVIAPATGAKQKHPIFDLGWVRDRQRQELAELENAHTDAKAALAACCADAQKANEALAEAKAKADKIGENVRKWRASWIRSQNRFVVAVERVQVFEKRRRLLATILRAVHLPVPGGTALAHATRQRDAAMKCTRDHEAMYDEAQAAVKRKCRLVEASRAKIECARQAVERVQQQALETQERHRLELLTPEQREAEKQERWLLAEQSRAIKDKDKNRGKRSGADLVRAKPAPVRAQARAPQTPLADGLRPRYN
ncbi:MobA/MobL family protein [Xanthomonas arboricola]|uniref:MobA/MobL family protein n=1 Tax=Xanthomonas arboricola TaxID=56448 RepID=UPI004040ACB9